MNTFLSKFADELKKTREEKKISLDQIFNKTRIDKTYLIAIEEGNFSILPEVYMKAFLKEYAKSIDLDPIEIISKYESAQKGLEFVSDSDLQEDKPKEEIKSEISDQTEAPQQTESRKTEVSQRIENNRIFYYIAVFVLMIVAIFVIYNTFLKEPDSLVLTERPFEETLPKREVINPDSNAIITSPVEADSGLQINSSSADQQQTVSQINGSSTGKLVLKIVATDKSWVRVVADEKENSEFILSKDMVKILSADSLFYMHIGNSGAISLFLNDIELSYRKEEGRVRKLNISKNGVDYLLRAN